MFEADGEQLALLGRVALAMLLGGVIGFEREIAGKPAGIRTHMLVAGMATVLVGLGQALIGLYDLDAPASALRPRRDNSSRGRPRSSPGSASWAPGASSVGKEARSKA